MINIDIDVLVQEVREKIRDSIVTRCGTMQVLDMTQPIGLNDIYINVNILETITNSRQLEIADLLQGCDPNNFDRWGLGRITEERVSGLTAVENYSKLTVLGMPGSGKTTFLKYLAIQCSLEDFKIDKIPIFITLKEFTEAKNSPILIAYIIQLLKADGVKENQIIEILTHGRAIILLDGLDEVAEENNQFILKQVTNFSQEFRQNQFVLTCRIARCKDFIFNGFTQVEISEFDTQQICNFATKWFAIIDPVKTNKFIQKIYENPPIKELATNPLLLTLLCLMFQETADFPASRLELYQEGLNLLLKKWDGQKNIERDRIYKKLSIQQKQDLLSQIALDTFEQGKYFFKRKELEQYIASYIYNLSSFSNKYVTLELDSSIVIKSIEVQHGLLVERAREIYSFSHLTFQEYFTARQILASSNPQALEIALKQLVSRITEKRWREVFLLTVGMMRKADYLLELMQQQTDQVVAQDEHLQRFLAWANQKSCTVTAAYKQAAIRAFYLTLGHTIVLVSSSVKLDSALSVAGDTMELAFSIDPSFTINCNAADLTLDRVLTLALARAIDMNREFKPAVELVFGINLGITLAVDPGLKHSLQLLKKQLPDMESDKEGFKQWCKAYSQSWTEQLRSVMISHCNIGHNWQLSSQQRETLRQYYNANQLLLECLNSNCYVTLAVRSHIEETLLLPVNQERMRDA